jgi:type IV pilus assembly protein PilC
VPEAPPAEEEAVQPAEAKTGFLARLRKPVGKPRLPFKEREYFTENLALLLKSAVPIGDALDSLKATLHSKAMLKALSDMQADVDAGYSLADALERSGLATGQTLALVRLGESSGHLVENIQLAALQEEKRHLLRAKVRSALIYPAFVLSLTVVVGLGVAWFLLPRLSQTFSQLQVHLPLISRAMIGVGIFLKAHGIIVVPLFALLVGVVMYVLFVAPKTKRIGKKLLFAIPGVGGLMTEIEIAQFGYLLGTLLEAALPITQAVTLLVGASSAPHYQDFYRYLARSLDDGYDFKSSMQRYKGSAKVLPPAVQQMIIAGERSGSLSEVMLTIGRTYEQKADVSTSNLEAIIEPIMLIVVWIGVMMVAIAVILPIYSLVGGLGK